MSAPLASLLLLASFVLCAQAEEGPAAAKVFVEECRKKFDLDMNQVKDNLMNKKLPDTEAGKCFMECMMEKLGLIKDGKVVAEKVKELNAMRFKDKPDIREKADQVVDKCGKEVGNSSKKCELVVDIIKCAEKYTKEMNIPDFSIS